MLEAIVAAAAANELWPELLPLVPELPAESQERLAREAAKLDPSQREEITRFARAAGMDEQLEMFEQVLGSRR